MSLLPRARALSPASAVTAYAALVCASLALFVYDTPIQLTDSFNHLLNVQGQSLTSIVRSYFFQDGYFRPLWWIETKLVFESSHGRYHEWFRGLHAFQTCVLIALVVALLRPRNWTDAAVVPLALAMVIGSHTFNGLVQEAFPVNHYGLAVIACLATALIARAAHRWWSDASVAGLFLIAAFTVESGLLVAVVALGAWLTGMRGLSRRGIVIVGLLFVAYFVMRLAWLGSNPPGLLERSSGFGFDVLGPEELVARFGKNPLPFYLYNIVCTALTVLLAEPRGGEFRITEALLTGRLDIRLAATAVAFSAATLTLALFMWHRRVQWRGWRLDDDDRLVLLSVIVLAGNSVMSYAYTKDVIAATAGVFFACAVFISVRDLLRRADLKNGGTPLLALLLVGVMAVTWSYRAAGSYAGLRAAAYRNRVAWASPDEWLQQQEIDVSRTEDRALMLRLQGDALYRQPVAVPLIPRLRGLLEFD